MAGGYWGVFFLISAATALVVLAVNWALGPTCCCRLQTAASLTELPSLRRLKNALKALDTITPLIEQSQGRISIEEIQAKMGRSPEKEKTDVSEGPLT